MISSFYVNVILLLDERSIASYKNTGLIASSSVFRLHYGTKANINVKSKKKNLVTLKTLMQHFAAFKDSKW